MLLAILTPFFKAAGRLLEELFKQDLANLSPLTLALLVAGLAILIAALSLLAGEIRSRFQK